MTCRVYALRSRRLSHLVLALGLISLLSASSVAQTFRVVHTFSISEGVAFSGDLIRDGAGNFYGSAQIGGANLYGVLYKLDSAGNLTVLHSFTGGADGGNPYGRLYRDQNGTLFGMTLYGGDPVCLCGTIYKLTSGGHFAVLHAFVGGSDGMQNIGQPGGGLLPLNGELYGVTYFGGDTTGCDVGLGCGTLFKITRSGHLTILYRFTGAEDGGFPRGLVPGPSGTLYGVTEGGYTGAVDGNIFQLDSTGNLSVLYDFSGASGDAPYFPPVVASDGSLIGTTERGGASSCSSGLCGVVYRFDPSSSTETVEHSFGVQANDGAEPGGALLLDGSDVVGVTFYGGIVNGACSFGCGIVYGITADGDYRILHSFTAGDDGSAPSGALTLDSSGNLFGVASSGGTNNDGVVFEITKD